MNEGPEFSDEEDDEPYLFKFVVSGSRLTYELEPIGRLNGSLGHSILFCPVIAITGWSDHKQLVESLRLRHLIAPNQEISHCLLDRDEVTAWSELLRFMKEDTPRISMQTAHMEYATRHGIRLVWAAKQNWADKRFLLHVANSQSAILPEDFVDQLLRIFDDFSAFCAGFEEAS